MTVRRMSPISPKVVRNWAMRWSSWSKPGEMVLLAVVAGHAILAAADGFADMSHDQVSLRSTRNTTFNATSALIGLDDVTDRGHRLVEAPRRLPVVVLH